MGRTSKNSNILSAAFSRFRNERVNKVLTMQRVKRACRIPVKCLFVKEKFGEHGACIKVFNKQLIALVK